MRILPILPLLRLPLVVLLIALLAGCAGGGGGGQPQQPPQQADPGGAGPGAAPDFVELKGATMTLGSSPNLRNPDLRYDPLPGSTITVISGGQIISQAVTGRDGIYVARLARGQRNSIRASKLGFEFERDVYHRTPNGPEILEFLAKPLPLAPPSAGQQQVDDPVGVGGQPAARQGRVIVNLTVDPTTGAPDTGLNGQVLIRDAVTNRIIDRHLLNDSNGFTYIGNTGKEIIIEPVVRNGLRWYPSSHRLRISQGRQEITFQWRADQPPAARPALPPFLTPSARPSPTAAPRVPASPMARATPTPRVPLPQAIRPPAVTTPQQASPMPQIRATPIPRLPSRPLSTVQE
jgi:hypothetical protein